MKQIKGYVIISLFFVGMLIAMYAFNHINTNRIHARYSGLLQSYDEMVKVTETLYERVEANVKGMGKLNEMLSDFGKDMAKKDDVKGLFAAVAELSDSISGVSEIKGDTITIQYEDQGFELDGKITIIDDDNASWKFDYKFTLELEAFSQEVTPGVYKTSLNTSNPNVEIKDFALQIVPYKSTFRDKFKVGLTLGYMRAEPLAGGPMDYLGVGATILYQNLGISYLSVIGRYNLISITYYFNILNILK